MAYSTHVPSDLLTPHSVFRNMGQEVSLENIAKGVIAGAVLLGALMLSQLDPAFGMIFCTLPMMVMSGFGKSESRSLFWVNEKGSMSRLLVDEYGRPQFLKEAELICRAVNAHHTRSSSLFQTSIGTCQTTPGMEHTQMIRTGESLGGARIDASATMRAGLQDGVIARYERITETTQPLLIYVDPRATTDDAGERDRLRVALATLAQRALLQNRPVGVVVAAAYFHYEIPFILFPERKVPLVDIIEAIDSMRSGKVNGRLYYPDLNKRINQRLFKRGTEVVFVSRFDPDRVDQDIQFIQKLTQRGVRCVPLQVGNSVPLPQVNFRFSDPIYGGVGTKVKNLGLVGHLLPKRVLALRTALKRLRAITILPEEAGTLDEVPQAICRALSSPNSGNTFNPHKTVGVISSNSDEIRIEMDKDQAVDPDVYRRVYFHEDGTVRMIPDWMTIITHGFWYELQQVAQIFQWLEAMAYFAHDQSLPYGFDEEYFPESIIPKCIEGLRSVLGQWKPTRLFEPMDPRSKELLERVERMMRDLGEPDFTSDPDSTEMGDGTSPLEVRVGHPLPKNRCFVWGPVEPDFLEKVYELAFIYLKHAESAEEFVSLPANQKKTDAAGSRSNPSDPLPPLGPTNSGVLKKPDQEVWQRIKENLPARQNYFRSQAGSYYDSTNCTYRPSDALFLKDYNRHGRWEGRQIIHGSILPDAPPVRLFHLPLPPRGYIASLERKGDGWQAIYEVISLRLPQDILNTLNGSLETYQKKHRGYSEFRKPSVSLNDLPMAVAAEWSAVFELAKNETVAKAAALIQNYVWMVCEYGIYKESMRHAFEGLLRRSRQKQNIGPDEYLFFIVNARKGVCAERAHQVCMMLRLMGIAAVNVAGTPINHHNMSDDHAWVEIPIEDDDGVLYGENVEVLGIENRLWALERLKSKLPMLKAKNLKKMRDDRAVIRTSIDLSGKSHEAISNPDGELLAEVNIGTETQNLPPSMRDWLGQAWEDWPKMTLKKRSRVLNGLETSANLMELQGEKFLDVDVVPLILGNLKKELARPYSGRASREDLLEAIRSVKMRYLKKDNRRLWAKILAQTSRITST